MFRKIQSSIFSYFFTIVIIALIVLVAGINSIITRFEKKSIDQYLKQITITVSSFADRKLENKRRDVIELSALFINSDKSDGTIDFDGHLKIAKEIAKAEDVLVIDTKKETVINSVNKGQEIGLNINDNAFIPFKLSTLIKNITNDKKEVYWGDIYAYSLQGGAPRIFLLSKISNSNIVLAYVFDPRKWELSKFIDANLEQSTDVLFVGSDGKLRSNSKQFELNPSAVLLRLSQQNYSKEELDKAKKLNTIIGIQKVDQQIIDELDQFNRGVIDVASVNGIRSLAMIQPIRKDGLNWNLVVEYEKTQAIIGWSNVRIYINILLIIIAAFFIIAVVQGGRKLAKPIYALRKALEELVDRPKVFTAANFENSGVTEDMLSKLESISALVKEQHEKGGKLKAKYEKTEKKLSKKSELLEQEIDKTKGLVANVSALEAVNSEVNQRVENTIRSIKRVLKVKLFDASVFSSSVENFFHMSSLKSDISSDFILSFERDSRLFFFLGDTNKHNTDAALYRMVINSLINDVVNVKKISSPDRILETLNRQILDMLKHDEFVFDYPVNLAVCVYDRQRQMIEFSSANQSIFIYRDTVLDEIQGDNIGIGGVNGEQHVKFENHYLPMNRVKNCNLYMFSDGYINQTNKENIPFGQSRLKELLIDIQSESIDNQKDYVQKTFIEWKGEENQQDDASILGLKLI
ncbi:PP2C family protein-serine/threonine phosphatase [Flammeovirga kamogawensis]|uniref:SpoIIE family protein phosphatase n=1 Tax=Flammeovirga kamogawensis TaxID=373891 RepID=A0ABX8GUT6_9BACT|nr:SpoIIE family protein phosphatase [Flammeovirga kamogawensis]MBB6459576.1 hypothetical protein [Flammeovirga kamogawensis]QWG07359.1 SpoIIE family protein phosphatase [Flammeovirga kamogawensis]TRX69175.1 SpoIIE family protein phosphatase [Flammeovirga kamogawensis]